MTAQLAAPVTQWLGHAGSLAAVGGWPIPLRLSATFKFQEPRPAGLHPAAAAL
jgi:hypothetical protein